MYSWTTELNPLKALICGQHNLACHWINFEIYYKI